ncbi:MAG: hypothetical protein RI947_1278 [Candidatus Parcubacteria bacterium]
MTPIAEGDAHYAQLNWHRPEDTEPFVSVRVDLLRLVEETANLRHNSVGRGQLMVLSTLVVHPSLALLPNGILDLEWDRDTSADAIQLRYPFQDFANDLRFAIDLPSIRFMDSVKILEKNLPPGLQEV